MGSEMCIRDRSPSAHILAHFRMILVLVAFSNDSGAKAGSRCVVFDGLVDLPVLPLNVELCTFELNERIAVPISSSFFWYAWIWSQIRTCNRICAHNISIASGHPFSSFPYFLSTYRAAGHVTISAQTPKS